MGRQEGVGNSGANDEEKKTKQVLGPTPWVQITIWTSGLNFFICILGIIKYTLPTGIF